MSEIEKYEDKDSWLDSFVNTRPDLFYPEAWTDDQRQEATAEVGRTRMKTAMFASIPMTCRARECPMAHRCQLLEMGLAPKGKPCPYEMKMTQEFTQNLMDELNVDEESLTEISQVRTLVNQEVQYVRVQNILNKDDYVLDAVIGINENTGEPIVKKELHPMVEMEDRILKRKKDLRQQMMATREAKAKIGQGKLDTAQTLSDIFSTVRELEIEKEKALKRSLGTLEVDEYITDAEIIEEEYPPLDEV
jgi:hypothetical protein